MFKQSIAMQIFKFERKKKTNKEKIATLVHVQLQRFPEQSCHTAVTQIP